MGRGAPCRTGDDTGQMDEAEALRELHRDWGSTWAIGYGAERWRAARRDGSVPVLTRASAAGLAMALRISHGGPR